MRSALLDLIPRIPATACHQRNYAERYSRYRDLVGISIRDHIGIFCFYGYIIERRLLGDFERLFFLRIALPHARAGAQHNDIAEAILTREYLDEGIMLVPVKNEIDVTFIKSLEELSCIGENEEWLPAVRMASR
jgi:hypothetical protein